MLLKIALDAEITGETKTNLNGLWGIQSSGSQPGAVLTPRTHLALALDISSSQVGRCYFGHPGVGARAPLSIMRCPSQQKGMWPQMSAGSRLRNPSQIQDLVMRALRNTPPCLSQLQLPNSGVIAQGPRGRRPPGPAPRGPSLHSRAPPVVGRGSRAAACSLRALGDPGRGREGLAGSPGPPPLRAPTAARGLFPEPQAPQPRLKKRQGGPRTVGLCTWTRQRPQASVFLPANGGEGGLLGRDVHDDPRGPNHAPEKPARGPGPTRQRALRSSPPRRVCAGRSEAQAVKEERANHFSRGKKGMVGSRGKKPSRC